MYRIKLLVMLVLYGYFTTLIKADNFSKDKVLIFKKSLLYKGVENHFLSSESHFSNKSGSVALVSHGCANALDSPSFKLEKGKLYMLGLYMKAKGLGHGQNIMVKVSGEGEALEMNWNISKNNSWEEVILPYRAKKTGLYHLSVFTYKYSLSNDGKYIQKSGQNLDRRSTILIDDFFLYESDRVCSREAKSSKKSFTSSFIKIDKLGNWFIKKDGKWTNFFPKFIYQDWSEDFIKSTEKYKNYGFTGYIDIDGADKLRDALKYGLTYNGIQINDINLSNKKDNRVEEIMQKIEKKVFPETSIILYQYDHEMEDLCNFNHKKEISAWITKHDAGSKGFKRVRPINMLNGMAEGVSRNLQEYYDIVSTYITQNEISNLEYVNPVNTLGLLQETDKLHTPTSIMQLQCNYQELFIPYLFKGIISGAKGLSFWRAGKNLPKNCHEHYEDNYWASVTKDVFEKIDKMLPIIREPLETSWHAKVDDPVHVALGTREHDGKEFIILSNFTKKDRRVNVHLQGQKGKRVFNFFTQKYLSNIKKDTFSVTMGHFNNGYLVLELR